MSNLSKNPNISVETKISVNDEILSCEDKTTLGSLGFNRSGWNVKFNTTDICLNLYFLGSLTLIPIFSMLFKSKLSFFWFCLIRSKNYTHCFWSYLVNYIKIYRLSRAGDLMHLDRNKIICLFKCEREFVTLSHVNYLTKHHEILHTFLRIWSWR